jgi:hypothetical protein
MLPNIERGGPVVVLAVVVFVDMPHAGQQRKPQPNNPKPKQSKHSSKQCTTKPKQTNAKLEQQKQQT